MARSLTAAKLTIVARAREELADNLRRNREARQQAGAGLLALSARPSRCSRPPLSVRYDRRLFGVPAI